MKWLCDYTKQDQRGFREVLDPNSKEYKHTGIHLMAADGYILENYDINLSSDDSSKNKIACQDVYIKLLSKPEDNSAIIIDSQTNIAFEDGLALAVKGPITLGKCKNLKIKSHDFGREVTLKGGFSLKGVTDSIIRFEKPREEMKKPITDGLISFNKVHKVDISIPENVKKAEIRDNFNGGLAILNGAPLNRIGISAFEIVMGSCNYSFHTQYSSLDISADIVRCESATFSSEYNGAIEVKSGKKDERSEFKAKEADFNFYGNGILKAYTPTLIFDSVKINHNGLFIPIKITNSTILVSPLIFFCSDALSLTNCVIKGQTTIDSAYEKDYKVVDGSYLITIDNSILKKAELIFNKDVGSKVSSVQISNSEIEGTFVAYDIEKVDGSLVNNSLVANVLSLKNSVLDSDEIRFDKITELDGYNSAAKTIVDKPKKEIGKVINELDIL